MITRFIKDELESSTDVADVDVMMMMMINLVSLCIQVKYA